MTFREPFLIDLTGRLECHVCIHERTATDPARCEGVDIRGQHTVVVEPPFARLAGHRGELHNPFHIVRVSPERVLLPRVIEVFTDVTLVGRLALTFVGRAGKDLVADPPLPPLEHAHLFQVRRRATLVAILKEVGQRKRHYRSSEARADNERRVPLL